MILEQYRELARRAHLGTSFSPERRAQTMISEYSEELEGDIKDLREAGISEESIKDYQSRYERYFTSYLHAKSNCLSSMIAGPSKFPTRRAEKANRSEERHYTIFTEWRKRALRSIHRKMQPEKTFLTELERYQKELAERELMQDLMKRGNAIIRKAKGSDCTAELLAAGFNDKLATAAQKPRYTGAPAFERFQFTNNLANIKRIRQRIAIVSRKEVLSTTVKERIYPFDGGEVIMNYESDRVQIRHTEKPPANVIQSLKSSAFKWSPTNKAWQRQITSAAIYYANQITNAGVPGE